MTTSVYKSTDGADTCFEEGSFSIPISHLKFAVVAIELPMTNQVPELT
jgi:hypothetical protein